MGTGLRSIERFSRADLNITAVGHSDVLEVGIQIGALAFLGLALLWRELFRAASTRLPLLTLGIFGALNGSLEYSAPLVLAVLLTVLPAEPMTRTHAHPANPAALVPR